MNGADSAPDGGEFGAVTDGDPDTPGLRGRLAAAAVSTLGVVLLGVPAYDIWDDANNLGWGIVSTLAENAVLIALALLLVGGGVWLLRREWPDDDAALVARWTLGGALFVTGVYGLVILFQLRAMGVLKPYVLAADGVVMGSIAAFGVGVYDVQRRQRRRTLTTQRDRFRSLFEDTETRIVTLDHRGDELVVGETNPAFDATFAVGFDELLSDVASVDRTRFDPDAFERATLRGEHYHEEIHVPPVGLTPAARDDDGDRPVEGRFYDLRTVHVDDSEERSSSSSRTKSGDDETFAVLPDVTAGKEREHLLSEQTERLSRQKSERERELEERTSQLEFLHSLLRHDIQNGMMVIDSRAEIMEDELDGRNEEFAETIRSRARDISDQIDRIRTTLDTLTEGSDTEPIDLSSILEARVATFRGSHPDVTVDVDVEPGLYVTADEILDDVFSNLLRNAVEHNDKQEVVIEVLAAGDGDDVRIEIADNGPGIPEADREQAFRRGTSNARAGGPGGSGFGLFFVDTMIDSYGGEIRAEDNDPEGTRFVITLPRSDGDAAAEPPR